MFVTGAEAQEAPHNDITISAFGVFQQSTNGNGVRQSADEQPGVLATYRRFVTDHQGFEFDYGFSQFNQNFTGIGSTPLNLSPIGITGTSLTVPTNTHEATMSYVYRFGAMHRLSPFFSLGTGVLVFSPLTSAVGTTSANTFVTPDFVYSGGGDFAVSRKVSLRLGYRGHVFEAPGFGIAQIKTGNVTHMAEPFAGLSFHW